MLKYLALKLCHFANFKVLVPAVPMDVSYQNIRPISTFDKAVTSSGREFRANRLETFDGNGGVRNAECGMRKTRSVKNTECRKYGV